MKRSIFVLTVSLVFFIFAAAAYAADAKITVQIPERYALVTITGVNPDEPLDKEAILKQMREQFEESDVQQFQYVIYNKGKKKGDGVRAYGEFNKNPKFNVTEFDEITGDAAQAQAKVIENLLGYQISPQELYAIYSDNEVVADDDFKGKPVILELKVPQVSKDFTDKPYIKITTDKYGLSGLHIYIDKKDPFLRKIKKGSEIIVRGYPKGFVTQDVMIDGVIIIGDGLVLVDGKVVSKDETKKK